MTGGGSRTSVTTCKSSTTLHKHHVSQADTYRHWLGVFSEFLTPPSPLLGNQLLWNCPAILLDLLRFIGKNRKGEIPQCPVALFPTRH